MRQFLCHLMILVMLTPALVCGPFMMDMSAQAERMTHEVSTMGDMPCHEMPVQADENQSHALMLFKDCAGIDLVPFDQSQTLEKPDLKVFKVLSGWHDLLAPWVFTPVQEYQIRGPPIETATADTYPPLYLTTQRLRI